MRYRSFGRTGLLVSELCLGTMIFGGKGFWEVVGKLCAKEVEATIGGALEAGVNFIDTADVYSEGESETLVGGTLAALARPREQLIVATKVRGRTGPGPNQVGLSRSHIMASIDAFDFPPVDRGRLPKVLDALRTVSKASDVSVARVALAWQLTKPFVTSIIIGAKSKTQLDDNLAAVDVKLAPEHVALLDAASALPPEYPGWMLDWQNREPRVQEAKAAK